MKNIHNILISVITALLFIVAQPAIAESNTGVDGSTPSATEEAMSSATIDDLLAQINGLSKDELRDFKKAMSSVLGMKKNKGKKKNSQPQQSYKKNKCKNKKNKDQAKNNKDRCKCKNKNVPSKGHYKMSEARQMNDGHGLWKDNRTLKSRKKCKGKKSRMQWNKSSNMGHGDRMQHRGFMNNYYGMRGMNNQQQHYGRHWPNNNSWGWGSYH